MIDKVILGIDPGTNIMGFGLIKCIKSEIKLLQYGIITLSKEPNHEMKLKKIFTRVTELIVDYKPDEMAIESPFFGKNVQSMLKLGRAQGVAMAAGLQKDVPIFEYAPKKIKKSITGNGNASKEQLAKFLMNFLKFEHESKNKFDATDALGAALCHHFQTNLKSKESSSWKKFVSKNKARIIN
tara:strand:- start:257 stop:805 length:549 start_codon:yes stop_codon:yes gene_type:complete